MQKELNAFTLIELLIVIIIIGILIALSLPQFGKTREHAIGKEAIASLKLIAAAEKIYRMEIGTYWPPSGTDSDKDSLNTNLKLSLTERNWDYSITGGTGTFTSTASRLSGQYLGCTWTINNTTDEPATTDCP
jgi:prepilin-type N-terminal cleavage/methylation domain-containing protein